MTAAATPAFAVTRLPLDEIAGVAVRGEIEIVTAPQLTAALDEAIRTTSGPFAIDLAAVDFLDSSGIHSLVRARALLGREDRPLALVCPRASIRRVLELTGLDQLVPVNASRDDLADALIPPSEAS